MYVYLSKFHGLLDAWHAMAPASCNIGQRKPIHPWSYAYVCTQVLEQNTSPASLTQTLTYLNCVRTQLCGFVVLLDSGQVEYVGESCDLDTTWKMIFDLSLGLATPLFTCMVTPQYSVERGHVQP